MRRLRRPLGALLLGLLATLAGLLALPASESGSRWLLARVPGLAVDGFRGRLLGAWSAERLLWQSAAARVELQAPRAALRLACLGEGALCLDELAAAALRIDLPAASAPGGGAFELPALRLPLGLRIARLQLGSLRIDGVDYLHDLAVSASLDRGGLQLGALDVRRPGLQLRLDELAVQPQGDWPLRARGRLQLPAVDGRAWQLELALDGELRRRLDVQARSSGYLAGELHGWLQPLAAGLPLQLTLRATEFRPWTALPAGLSFPHIELQASGALLGASTVQGSATLAGRDRPVAVALRGRVGLQGAEVEQLRLQDAAGAPLQAAGTLDWRNGFAADLRLDGGAFDWQQLWPLPALAVELRQVRGSWRYAAGAYQGDVDLQLRGPAGELQLRTPLHGEGARLALPGLQLLAGKGHAGGDLQLDFAAGVAWDARLALADLDPAYWCAALPGRIGGQLAGSGRWQDGALQARADWALAGQLRRQPLKLDGRLQGDGGRWRLDGLDLRLGDNRIDGGGQWHERLDGRLRLALPRLDQLWPGLRGRLAGELALAGTPAAPQGRAQLAGAALGYGAQSLAQLQLDGSVDARQQGELRVAARGLRSAGRDFGRLALNAAGSLARHSAELSVDGEPLRLNLALAGGLDARRVWRGELQRGAFGVAGLDWQLRAPAAVERSASGRVDLGAHCWQSQQASLCAEAQRLLPEPQLRLRLRDLDLARLGGLLPEDLAIAGQLAGDLRLDLAAAGPSGELSLDAGSGALRLRQAAGGPWLEVPYRQLALSSRLRPQRVDSRLALSGPSLGSLELLASLDPRPASRPLSGSFRVDGLDLGLARPFVERLERLEGRIDGSGRLSGGLLAPVVDGHLRLRDGRLGGGDLPLAVDDLQLTLDIAGQQAQLDGSWRSGAQGRGSLDGSLGWAGEPQLDLRLHGSRLPLAVEPYAQLEADPDLRLSLRERRLLVGGQLAVPRGQIKVRELPAQAVKVSDDAQVVGAPAPHSALPGVQLDVRLLLGAERLRFSGFGLDADLKGSLQVKDNLDSRGTLQLDNGRYRAYGQRLTLRRARLIFAGPIDQPLLDIEAVRTVDEVTAGLRLSGRADAPVNEVFAEPSMPQQQALSYLVLGRAPSTGNESNMVNQAALALGLAGGAPVAGALAERLGVKDFQLESKGSGLTSSVVASGYISDKLSLRYGVGVFEPASTFALRYELSKKLYLEAASGLASSLDIFYKKDF